MELWMCLPCDGSSLGPLVWGEFLCSKQSLLFGGVHGDQSRWNKQTFQVGERIKYDKVGGGWAWSLS